jgi:hypothetical protein
MIDKYPKGTMLIVTINLYEVKGRTKGDVVISTGTLTSKPNLSREYLRVKIADGTFWEYREDEIRPLTKLEKVLK